MPPDTRELYKNVPSLQFDEDPRARLRRLPGLASHASARSRVPCKICGAASRPFDRVDFNKYCNPENPYEFGYSGVSVDYLRCEECGFLFTKLCDAWSADDFRNFIYNDDYAKVDSEYADVRPLRTAQTVGEWFRGAEGARILDYGSGAGWFARSMRHAGYAAIEEYDPFSAPQRPQGRFDIITCFEVIEHSPDPRATFSDLLSLLRPDGCILLSQTLQPDDILAIRGSWWYLAPRNGHVSTFTEDAFERLGREFGLRFFRGETIYGFAGPEPGPHAAIALQAIGPSFTTVRLFAPQANPDAPIVSADGRCILWHRCEIVGGRPVRYTGNHRRLLWRAKWAPVSRIRVHVPFVHQAEDGFAARCQMSLDGELVPCRLVRGDIAAEFAVDGKTTGEIELVTPEPVVSARTGGRSVGIAVPFRAGCVPAAARKDAGEGE